MSAAPPYAYPQAAPVAYGAPQYGYPQPAAPAYYGAPPPQNVPTYGAYAAPPQPAAAPYQPKDVNYEPAQTYQAPAYPAQPHAAVPVGASFPGDKPYQTEPTTGSQYAEMMERRVRHGFILKVYGILSVQLLVTFGIVCIFSFVGAVKAAVQNSPGILWAAFAVSFGMLIALACCPNTTQRSPTSYICLALFTLAEGYLVGAIASYYEPEAVAMAMGSTVVIAVGLTLFACQTRIDFTAWAGSLFVILLAFTIFAIVAGVVRSNILRFAIAAIGVCIFGVFLVFDTQMVIGRRGSALKYDIDDAVVAALNIYIDVVQMFLYLLRLFGRD